MQNLIILTPIYNEESLIEEFLSTINKNLKSIKNFNIHFLFINDGSTDKSEIKINKISKFADNIDLINLKKNYGKEIAMQIGLIHVYLNKKNMQFLTISSNAYSSILNVTIVGDTPSLTGRTKPS